MKYNYVPTLRKILENKKEKTIFIWGDDYFSWLIYENLQHMGLDCRGFVSDNPAKESLSNKAVINVYELLYEENLHDLFILGFAVSGHAEIYSILTGIGLRFEDDFVLFNIAGYIQHYTCVDSFLGYSRIYNDLLGFKVYGDPEEAELKIMVLGGSTSDPELGGIRSWPEILFESFSEKRILLYSGGMGGYSTGQELLKFIRDGLILWPDFLINMSGYNDVCIQTSLPEHPLMHKYYAKCFRHWEKGVPMVPQTLDMRAPKAIEHGIRFTGTDVDNYVNNMRLIHAVSEEFGIKHLCFLQPMIESGNAVIDETIISLKELWYSKDKNSLEIQRRVPFFAKECSEKMAGYDYFEDLSDLFDQTEDVYMDHCHYTEKGNSIIAEAVKRRIVEEFEK